MDNKDYTRVLSYSYYTTITGWGVLLKYITSTPGVGGSESIVLDSWLRAIFRA